MSQAFGLSLVALGWPTIIVSSQLILFLVLFVAKSVEDKQLPAYSRLEALERLGLDVVYRTLKDSVQEINWLTQLPVVMTGSQIPRHLLSLCPLFGAPHQLISLIPSTPLPLRSREVVCPRSSPLPTPDSLS